jgi:hypothetical protein
MNQYWQLILKYLHILFANYQISTVFIKSFKIVQFKVYGQNLHNCFTAYVYKKALKSLKKTQQELSKCWSSTPIACQSSSGYANEGIIHAKGKTIEIRI